MLDQPLIQVEASPTFKRNICALAKKIEADEATAIIWMNQQLETLEVELA